MGTELYGLRVGKDDGRERSKGANNGIGFGKKNDNERETPEGIKDEDDDCINTQ